MYYVYIYLDPRYPGQWSYKDKVFNFKPFYVGEGKGNRMLTHLFPWSLKLNSIRSSTIKAIIEQNLSPIFFKLYDNISKEESCSIEIDLIKHFGRQDVGSGILGNHTDGGEGWNRTQSLKKRIYKKFYCYSMDGVFEKEYTTKEIEESFKGEISNVSTSIKRKGSCLNRQWFYEYKGDKIDPIIKYQMPRKYINIRQIDIGSGKVIATYKNSREVKMKFKVKKISGLTNCFSGRSKSFLNFKWEADIYEELPD